VLAPGAQHVGINGFHGENQRPHQQNSTVWCNKELARKPWYRHDHYKGNESANGEQIVVRHQFVACAGEEEEDNTCQTYRQPHKHHHLKKEAQFALAEFQPKE